MLDLKNILSQVKNLLPAFVAGYALVGLLLFSAIVISSRYNIKIEDFLRDPLAIANLHPFTGIISNIGILFWCATAAITFFTSYLLLKSSRNTMSAFLFFSGLLTSMLLADDLFMLHERIFPWYLHTPESAVYVMYILLTLGYLFKFAKTILQTEYVALFIALSFFAGSVLCDVFVLGSDLEYIVEDGLKFAGIITWFIYFLRTCITSLAFTNRTN